jgi:hypothetical protein
MLPPYRGTCSLTAEYFSLPRNIFFYPGKFQNAYSCAFAVHLLCICVSLLEGSQHNRRRCDRSIDRAFERLTERLSDRAIERSIER